ncbi:MAG TPA: type II toxin-antitoxin system VapC family toxin [Candidatus Sulfotelmatobacter sp.]
MIILDTNVLSALMLRVPEPIVAAWLDRQPEASIWTTSITLFEIRFGLEAMPFGRRQAALLEDLNKLLVSIDHRITSFDADAAHHAGVLMASRKREGRPRELRDTMIAGIVLSRHATLATRNIRDFDDVGAKLVDPWDANS